MLLILLYEWTRGSKMRLVGVGVGVGCWLLCHFYIS
jgi:hypothetical protein